MAEWSKAHAWRACGRPKPRPEGSNPSLSAILFAVPGKETQPRAAKAREPRQVRKEATVSGSHRVPRQLGFPPGDLRRFFPVLAEGFRKGGKGMQNDFRGMLAPIFELKEGPFLLVPVFVVPVEIFPGG